ncbi:MAG: hypothetical protein K9J13_17495 [Saprospiraceae bacterium]|nr:hypothetical protein [Saprospiraceae bacterium]
MRKIEKWMQRGKKVKALGNIGKITSLECNRELGYVYRIHVRLNGEKRPRICETRSPFVFSKWVVHHESGVNLIKAFD